MSCIALSSNIKSINQVSGNDRIWHFVLNTDDATGRIGGGEYKFTMTTNTGLDYQFVCDITNFDEYK